MQSSKYSHMSAFLSASLDTHTRVSVCECVYVCGECMSTMHLHKVHKNRLNRTNSTRIGTTSAAASSPRQAVGTLWALPATKQFVAGAVHTVLHTLWRRLKIYSASGKLNFKYNFQLNAFTMWNCSCYCNRY